MSGRLHAYVVAYDIRDDRRRKRVANLLLSYGERVQESVFMVGANAATALRLNDELREVINMKNDSVIVCDLGKYDERISKCVFFWKHVDSGLDRSCLIL